MPVPNLRAGADLPVREVIANNFAVESENRMHADDVAAEFGFAGGLVPGVGVFAYLTQPIVAVLGRAWLERGRIAARFVRPVYHAERVTVRASVEQVSPPRFNVEVLNQEGTACGVAEAELPAQLPTPPDPADYPRLAPPAHDKRLPASITSFRPGEAVLGSLEFEAAWQSPLEGPDPFVDAVCDPLEVYRGPQAACHPALVVARANHLLSANIDLGPWIHTSSVVQYFALPDEGELLSLRGQVTNAYVKREHEFIEADLAMFDAADRPIAQVLHTAIIRPARRQTP